MRMRGSMVPMEGEPLLEQRQLQDGIYAILTELQRKVFEETRELDLAYSVHDFIV